MTLQKTLAALLGRREKLGSEQCAEELAKIATRLEEINQRSVEIDYNAGGRPGPALKSALEMGTPQQVVELQREAELLEAERDSLVAQHEALKERRQAAIAEESLPLCRDLLQKLPAAVVRAEKASRELAEARAELERTTDAFSTGRRTARDGGHQPPAMDEKLLERVFAVRGTTNQEARVSLRLAWTGQPPPHVIEARRLDQERWDREEERRQAWAAREARRLEGNAA